MIIKKNIFEVTQLIFKLILNILFWILFFIFCVIIFISSYLLMIPYSNQELNSHRVKVLSLDNNLSSCVKKSMMSYDYSGYNNE